MHNDGEVQFGSQCQVKTQGLLLNGRSNPIAIEIQPNLPYGHNRSTILVAPGVRQSADGKETAGRPVALVGMEPDSRKDGGVAFRHGHRGLARRVTYTTPANP